MLSRRFALVLVDRAAYRADARNLATLFPPRIFWLHLCWSNAKKVFIVTQDL
jgi:hypothetical protein